MRYSIYLCITTEIVHNIIRILTGQEANLIRFVDITGLLTEQNRGMPHAIFFGLGLIPSYIHKKKETADYVQTMVAQNRTDKDEFSWKELKAGKLSDQIADLLVAQGYEAYSLSDKNLLAICTWDEKNLKTIVPQKRLLYWQEQYVSAKTICC